MSGAAGSGGGGAGLPGRGPLPWLIARRFFAGRRSRLLDGTARAALAATALGVTAMVVAMALMTGYTEDLQDKLIGRDSAVGIYPLTREAAALPPEVLAELSAIPGVDQVAPVAYLQGLLTADGAGEPVEVTVRGVAPGGSGIEAERLAIEDGIPGAALGSELAQRLGVAEGDVVRLTALGLGRQRPTFRYRSLRVRATFSRGFSEVDRSWLMIDREVALGLVGDEASAGLYELGVADPRQTSRVAELTRAAVGEDYLVSDSQDLNRELFRALRLQKLVLFFVLGLIVLVSTFNVASTLMVLVRERMRDIGALAAMGLERRRLRSIFVLYGLALGALGTALGIALGTVICWLLTTFELVRFGPEIAAIYFIDSVPFRVEAADLAAIAALSLALTAVVCFIPAWRAGRTDPATALRYE